VKKEKGKKKEKQASDDLASGVPDCETRVSG
jgi:hypothetical protein